MKIIPVKLRGKKASVPALVDDKDHEILKKYSWICDYKGYAVTTITVSPNKRIGLKMHRMVLGLLKNDGRIADHIDSNRLNNQSSNLRTCTAQQNAMNARKRKNATSKYKGVSFRSDVQKWLVQIYKGNKRCFRGLFENEAEAAKQYDCWATKLHGEFARLNFPAEEVMEERLAL